MSKKLIYVASSVFCISLILASTANAYRVGWWKLDEGMGLTALNERVKMLNGCINILSTEGEGTSIEIKIPFRMKLAYSIQAI